MTPTTMAKALNTALRDALRADERVLVFGEDVGRLGGVFRVTDGLAADFGEHRCFDTPVAESGIVGLAVGLAMAGFRPVVEMQFDAFAYPAFEQIASHVAKLRNRTRGALTLPIVLRVPYGGGIGGVEHHSDSSEAYYAHTAGLKVVTPATVGDAYALLREAIDDPDPVVFLEPKRHYWTKEDVELPLRAEPFGTAAVRRAGSDVTLVAYGPAVAVALAAAEEAAVEGLDVEVLDLRTLVPLDDAGLVNSVLRTGRCVVVHEAQGFAGVGAEIVARVQERCFDALRAPVLRVTGLDVPYPPPLLEHAHLPDAARVLTALRRVHPEPVRGPERTFHLPDLGEGLTEAEVVEWLVRVGDQVTHDQPLVEVETAKSLVSLPSPYAGVVTALHCDAGVAVEVGAALVSVAEVPPTQERSRPDSTTEALPESNRPTTDAGSGAVLTGYGTGRTPKGTTPNTPSRTPLNRATADKFLRAQRDTPAVTIWADTDATDLLARKKSEGVGLLALLAEAAVKALEKYPEFNSRIDPDRGELIQLPHINLAFAAQTPKGLTVPVARNANTLPLRDLSAELTRLTALARTDTLPPDHLTGGTFTLNNYGPLGVDGATPLLNHPQTAMLGAGRLTDRPWAVNGEVTVRTILPLSLTFDHRTCDGASAAGFLHHAISTLTQGS
ncbi:transketolase [Streptomyces sp. LBUM 1476]|nr:transketolase [Streptomyces sp. LBUM 1476]MBZ3915226.1 2-oxo acid dehydrogenase subunit E2 [Streptomyces acidiscabies]GAQ54823.1 3-methyl-2-oxobutanoate dehydrogenase subunit [Streptomyces acidiscabies]GAV43448.1 3-methyl-2-oxobutanoate dehydrogenase subunit [Streptomyces acidiscabies]